MVLEAGQAVSILAGERTRAPLAELVDASVKRSTNILDLSFESAVEGLAATEAPCFLCFTLWTSDTKP